jgi:hypothetical protein
MTKDYNFFFCNFWCAINNLILKYQRRNLIFFLSVLSDKTLCSNVVTVVDVSMPLLLLLYTFGFWLARLHVIYILSLLLPLYICCEGCTLNKSFFKSSLSQLDYQTTEFLIFLLLLLVKGNESENFWTESRRDFMKNSTAQKSLMSGCMDATTAWHTHTHTHTKQSV